MFLTICNSSASPSLPSLRAKPRVNLFLFASLYLRTCQKQGVLFHMYCRNKSLCLSHFLLSFLSDRKGLLSTYPVQFPALCLRSDCFLDVKHSQAPITFSLACNVQEPSQVSVWAKPPVFFFKDKSFLFFLCRERERERERETVGGEKVRERKAVGGAIVEKAAFFPRCIPQHKTDGKMFSQPCFIWNSLFF